MTDTTSSRPSLRPTLPGMARILTRWTLFASLVAGALLAPLSPVATAKTAAPASALWQTYVTPGAGVAWQPWGPEAIARARSENKLLFLHLADASSELARAMHTQSFAQAETVTFLREQFICVLVDRAEHAELAALAQAYVQGVKQLTGSPLHLWLVPDTLEPADGASYLPPSEEWGKESFMKVAQRVAAAWSADPAAVRAAAADSLVTLRAYLERFAPPAPVFAEQAAAGAAEAQARLDAATGGFGEPPRYHQPELLRFLLRHDATTRTTAVAALHALAGTAARDPLDGGFYRATTDTAGRIPAWQKTALDQARLAAAYLHAARLATDPALAAVARGALDYTLTTLVRADGAVFAGEYVASGAAPAIYLWSLAEIEAALGADAAAFTAAHQATSTGNIPAEDDPGELFKGRNVLHRALAPESTPDAAAAATLEAARARLLTARATRPAPARDENVVATTQGLVLAAFARGSAQLQEPRYLAAAQRLAAFIRAHLVLDTEAGTLRRLAGSDAPAIATDYAAIAHGLRVLHSVAPDAALETLAAQLERTLLTEFRDPTSGRLFLGAASEPTPATRWLRLFTPAPGPSEAPSAEALALLTLPASPERAALATAALADLTESLTAAAPRADLLWALATLHAPTP